MLRLKKELDEDVKSLIRKVAKDKYHLYNQINNKRHYTGTEDHHKMIMVHTKYNYLLDLINWSFSPEWMVALREHEEETYPDAPYVMKTNTEENQGE
jgi:hypothetical protein